MPKLTDNTLEVASIKGTNFQYSAVRLDKLGATEYTLVTIVADVSGSVSLYKDDLEKCLKEIVTSCRRSPRADNLMIRLLVFNHHGDEIHGYKLLTECNPDDYVGILHPHGNTALYDATYNAVLAASGYAEVLTANDFSVNGIVFVLTDGMDNASAFSSTEIKKTLTDITKKEHLDSLVTILIGVNLDPAADTYLKSFQTEAGFSQYINIGEASEKKLAKLAEFVSKSISSSSTALGTGQPGQIPSLTF
jgi:hypothetical protein